MINDIHCKMELHAAEKFAWRISLKIFLKIVQSELGMYLNS